MVIFDASDLDNVYAVPLNHPITCGNPAPWKIIGGHIELRYNEKNNNHEAIVRIRGNDSMWFRADGCYLTNSLQDAEDFIKIREFEQLKKNLYYSYIT